MITWYWRPDSVVVTPSTLALSAKNLMPSALLASAANLAAAAFFSLTDLSSSVKTSLILASSSLEFPASASLKPWIKSSCSKAKPSSFLSAKSLFKNTPTDAPIPYACCCWS